MSSEIKGERQREKGRCKERGREGGGEERERERGRYSRRGELVRGERMRTGFMLYIIPMTDAPHRFVLVRERRRGEKRRVDG